MRSRVRILARRVSVTSGLATASVRRVCLVPRVISRVPRARGDFTASTAATVPGRSPTDAIRKFVHVLV